MSAHGADHEPDGKMAHRTVTDFEPGGRFVWSNGDQLHRWADVHNPTGDLFGRSLESKTADWLPISQISRRDRDPTTGAILRTSPYGCTTI